MTLSANNLFGMSFCPVSITKLMPVSGDHISNVVSLSSRSKMPRITARRIVAGMKTQQFSESTNRKKERNSMGLKDSLRNVEYTVIMPVSSNHPRPAFVFSSNIHTPPKSKNISRSQVHKKKSARQNECACAPLPSKAKYESDAVLVQPARELLPKNGGNAR